MTAALPALPGYRSTTRTSTCRAPRHCKEHRPFAAIPGSNPRGDAIESKPQRAKHSCVGFLTPARVFVAIRARRRGCLCGDGEGRRRALLPRRHALHDELVHVGARAVTALAHCVPEAFTAKRENHPVAGCYRV